MSNRFWFHGEVPEEVISACKSLLEENEHLIPSWCNKVRVYWDAEGDENDNSSSLTGAYIETSYAYRNASLTICPAFLSETPEDREALIKHELLHIVSGPLITHVRTVSEALCKDEAYSAIIEKQNQEKIESLTEDLTIILLAIESKLSKKK
jgi:hypothetical protein